MNLLFPSDNGTLLKAEENTLVLFIDETGDESLKDPNFPIFGFGAVGTLGKDYLAHISYPWIQLKEEHFMGEETQMHAADLLSPTNEQCQAIGGFFVKNSFLRFAVILSDSAAFEDNFDRFNVVAAMFYQRLKNLIRKIPFSDIILVFEDSQRGNRKVRDYFERYHFERTDSLGLKKRVSIRKATMKKNEREPGLELADFVAHTAGASVKARLAGKRTKENERKDFEAVFKKQNLSDFFEITKVKC